MSFGGGGNSDISEQTAATSKKALAKATSGLTDISQQVLSYTKDFQDKYINPAIAKLNTATAAAQANNNAILSTQNQITQGSQQLFEQTGIPLIQKYAQQVQDFSSPAYAEQQAQLGIGDVQNQQQIAQGSQARQLSARGISANSGQAISANAQSDTQFAIAKAAAAQRARALADQQALNVGSSGANLGVQLQGNVSASNQTAASINAAGAGLPTAALNSIANAQSAQYPGYNAATSPLSTVASTQASVTSNAVSGAQKSADASNEGIGSLIGTVAGAAIPLLSDRRLKKDVEPISKLENGLIMYSFRYKWEDDLGPKHHGFMADEVEKLYPEAVHMTDIGFKAVDYSKLEMR